MEEQPLNYRTLPVSGLGNLDLPLDRELRSLQSVSDSLLREALSGISTCQGISVWYL